MADIIQTHDRIAAIRDLLFAQGEMRLPELADSLGVSLATIRRDVAALADQGVLARSHGRARIAEPRREEVAFGAREQVALAAKRAIAATALEQLHEGESVFLDAGTTVLQLAKYLRLQPRRLTVFTNGVAVAEELAQVPEICLTVLGGRLRPENLSTVGPFALDMLERIWVDRLFLGTSALDADGRLSSHDQDEAQLNAAMLRRAGRAHLLADQSKFSQRAIYEVARPGPEAPALNLITDALPPPAMTAALKGAGYSLTLAQRGPV